MRRLAKQNRDDEYATRRDYQEIHATASVRLRADGGVRELSWAARAEPVDAKSFFGAGGFIRVLGESEMLLSVRLEDQTVERSYHVGNAWLRFGVGLDIERPAEVIISLTFAQPQELVDVWGLTASTTEFPVGNGAERPPIADLNEVHLLPETLYLDHSSDLPPTLTGMSDVVPGERSTLRSARTAGAFFRSGLAQQGPSAFTSTMQN